jgi:hypothetical protein
MIYQSLVPDNIFCLIAFLFDESLFKAINSPLTLTLIRNKV